MAPPKRAPRPLDGLVWPLVPGSEIAGDRSTTYANKQALAAAVGAVDSSAAEQVLAERKFRQRYGKHVQALVNAQLSTPDAALKSSQAGLKWMHDNFEFVRDGKTMKLSEAMASIKSSFETGVIKGSKPKPATPPPLRVPYKDRVLEGPELAAQVRRWVSYGTIEPSAGEALIDVAAEGRWRDLSDKYFVLLGAGSAMGPLHLLLELGANVVAIDLDRPGIWKRLLGLAEKSSGTMIFPMKAGTKQAGLSMDELAAVSGSNLLSQTPEILNWLRGVAAGKPLSVGAYAYLDGEMHVRVSLAMDAIIQGLTESRKGIMPCYLCTPTDVHVVPEEAYRAMKANLASLRPSNVLLKLSPFYWLGLLRPNPLKPVAGKDGTQFYVVDGLVNKQGPSYALAKRLQHWRAVVSREQYGCRVSSNVAPSTATASVTSNRLFAMAYGGMHWFVPMEVFQQETSNAVMGALLLRDTNDVSTANPANPTATLKNPLQLFSYGSLHGGVWRMAYKIDSIGEASVVFYLLQKLLVLVLVVAVGILATAAATGRLGN